MDTQAVNHKADDNDMPFVMAGPINAGYENVDGHGNVVAYIIFIADKAQMKDSEVIEAVKTGRFEVVGYVHAGKSGKGELMPVWTKTIPVAKKQK